MTSFSARITRSLLSTVKTTDFNLKIAAGLLTEPTHHFISCISSDNMTIPPPITPKTPSSLLAALALSPTLATTHPSSIPVFALSPPTPDPPSPKPTQPASTEVIHRKLASNEARQLTLLLTQHLFPVRHSPKGLMSESIALAELLHDAGLRWDRHRRVMGLHLRGIWEEGQRLGTGKMVGGHGPME